MHACIHIRVYANESTHGIEAFHVWEYMHARTHAKTRVYANESTHGIEAFHVWEYMHACMHAFTYVSMRMKARMVSKLFTYVSACMHACTHKRVAINIKTNNTEVYMILPQRLRGYRQAQQVVAVCTWYIATKRGISTG